MNRSQRSKSTNSSRESELNLTVQGSPCPRGPRPLKKPSQPANSPTRPVLLPIDHLMQYRSEIEKLEDGCIISGRSNSGSSSHPELAIDLSSVSDSFPGSRRSSDSSYDESDWSWFPKKHFKVKQSSCSSVPRTYEKISSFRQSDASFRTNESVCSRCSSKLRGTDLIEVYVKTVNNAELSKFFRPCGLCGQQSCNCPPSPLTPKCDSCLEKNCKCVDDEKVSACSECRLKYCLCLPKKLYVDDESYEENGPVLVNAEQTVDSGNSTLLLDDSCRDVAHRTDSGILSKQHVSLSVMQLATAAQCARILADSLENVLQLAREELTPEVSRRTENRNALMESAFPQDSLLSAIEALNRTSNTK